MLLCGSKVAWCTIEPPENRAAATQASMIFLAATLRRAHAERERSESNASCMRLLAKLPCPSCPEQVRMLPP